MAISFDGAGDQKLLKDLLDLGTANQARFTLFLSGVYFVTKNEGDKYNAPQKGRGVSDIGFNYEGDGLSAKDWVEALVKIVNKSKAAGFELGTHYNGHFCGSGGVDNWGVADWNQEIDEFFKLTIQSHTLVGNPKPLQLTKNDVRGGRTPCLEGNKTALYSALKSRGFRYDSSETADRGAWPAKRNGIWSYPLVSIPLSDGTGPVLSMDYNLCFYKNKCESVDQPAANTIETRTYKSYMNYFQNNYDNNRAPLHIGHHTTLWHRRAYWKALLRFVKDVCTKPEVACVTYTELSDFMDTNTGSIATFARSNFDLASGSSGASGATARTGQSALSFADVSNKTPTSPLCAAANTYFTKSELEACLHGKTGVDGNHSHAIGSGNETHQSCGRGAPGE